MMTFPETKLRKKLGTDSRAFESEMSHLPYECSVLVSSGTKEGPAVVTLIL